MNTDEAKRKARELINLGKARDELYRGPNRIRLGDIELESLPEILKVLLDELERLEKWQRAMRRQDEP